MASLTSTFLKPLRNVVSNYYATQTESLIKFIMKGSSLSLIDVGAAGDIEPRWRQVSRLLNYYGFEPDLRSYNDLKNKNNCPQFTVFNKAIWNNNQKIKIHLYYF